MAEPWIRVHANLVGKPVVWRAVEALSVSQHEALGLLVTFWGSVSQHATNGAIAPVPDAQLEAWAGWRGKRGRFASFIREHHMDADGRVNEWDDYAGKLEGRREQERTRKKHERERTSRGRHADSPQDVTRPSLPTIRDDTIRDEASTATAPWQSEAETALAGRLPSDTARDALAVVLESAPSRISWAAELNAMLEGMAGHVPASPSHLAEALQEFAADGHANQSTKLSHFKRYVEKIVTRPELSSRPRETAKQNGGPTGRAALMLSQIRALVQESRQPGQATRRFIPRAQVVALGEDVALAYDAIGGADRLLSATGEQMGFVIRDFTQALEAAHVHV